MYAAWNCAQTSLFVYAVCKFPFRFTGPCTCFSLVVHVEEATITFLVSRAVWFTGEFSCWWSCDRLTSDLSRLIWPRYAGRFLRRIEHLIGDAETRLVFTDWFPSVVLIQNIHKENFIERESGIFSSSAGAKLARKQFPTNAQCFCQYASEIQQMWNEWTTRRVGLLVRDTVRKFSHSIPTMKWGLFKTYKCENFLDFPWELLEDKS